MNAPAQPYHHGNLRQALLDKAMEHLVQQGPAQISLRALAREIGVSQTAPYRHFSDKTALLAALAAEGFNRLQNVTRVALDESADTHEILISSGMAYIGFARANPELYKLMFGPVIGSPGEYPELEQAGGKSFQVILEIIQRGVAEGLFPVEDSLLVANTAWATVHGLSSLLIDGLYQCIGVQDPERQLERSLRIAMTGFERRH